MKKIITVFALIAASFAGHAATVEVSKFLAIASVSGETRNGPYKFTANLMDTSTRCPSGQLNVLVEIATGSAIGCWHIVGSSVYLSDLAPLGLRDLIVPTRSFKATDKGRAQFPNIQWGE